MTLWSWNAYKRQEIVKKETRTKMCIICRAWLHDEHYCSTDMHQSVSPAAHNDYILVQICTRTLQLSTCDMWEQRELQHLPGMSAAAHPWPLIGGSLVTFLHSVLQLVQPGTSTLCNGSWWFSKRLWMINVFKNDMLYSVTLAKFN